MHVAVHTQQLDFMRVILQCDDDRHLKDDGILFKQQQQQPDDNDNSSGAADHRSIDDPDHQRTPWSPVNICPRHKNTFD